MAENLPLESMPDDLTVPELKQALREARIDRDGWHIQARLAENHLSRILRSPAWKITKPFRILNLLAWKLNPSLHDLDSNEWEIRRTGPTVWDVVHEELTIETSNANLESPKIALLAQWSRSSQLSHSTVALISGLLANQYEVVMVSACEEEAKLDLPHEITSKITIIRKPNYGYDFGSWSIAFHLFPQLFSRDELLILNDSNAGPFGPIDGVLAKLSDSQFDVTGITDSLQIRYHLQSYMVHFKNGALAVDALRNFWLNVREQEEKMAIVQAYELGLSSVTQSSGLFTGAIYPWNLITDYWENPSVSGAKRLLEIGLPFVKREVIRDSSPSELKALKSTILEKYPITASELDEFLKVAAY